MSDYGRLPSCQRCKARKVRCDRNPPKCMGCLRANAACVISDPGSNEIFPRDYIHRLEERERYLQAKVAASEAVSSPAATADREPENSESTRGGRVQLSEKATIGSSGFVGHGSGLSFARSMFSSDQWQICKAQLQKVLSAQPQASELSVNPNAQPSHEEASALLNNYFTGFHVHHPFLLRQDTITVFQSIYNRNSGNLQPPSPQDHFRLLTIFAISAVTFYRTGRITSHPYGYYLSAQKYLDRVPLLGDAESVQNLLLIARFGMYYHIGTSLWEISQLCMRQCIEWGYHTNPRKHLSPLQEQHRRRIFWECFILDRYSSGILGRPFAIADADISVDLPISVDDVVLVRSHASTLSDIQTDGFSGPTELSVFVHIIRLRCITSRIHSYFWLGSNNGNHQTTSPSGAPAFAGKETSAGYIYVQFYKFVQELENWRDVSPVFSTPACLYETPEWFDFLVEKDKLLLIRGALHKAPTGENMPRNDLLSQCLECATRVIELYADMFRRNFITWTRSYFQILFTAGVSIIHSVSLELQGESRAKLGDPNYKLRLTGRSNGALMLCSDVLNKFATEMPDSRSFAVVFDALCGKSQADPRDSVTERDSTTMRNSVLAQPQMARAHNYNHERSLAEEPILNASLNERRAGNPTYSNAHGSDQGTTPMPGYEVAIGSPAHDDYLGSMMRREPIDPPGQWSPIDPSGMPGLQNEVQDLGMPVLTDQMMAFLEAGLGEYAWGDADGDLRGLNSFDILQ